VLQQTHGLCLRAEIGLDRFILSPSGDENPQFLPFLGLRRSVVSTVGGNLRKLNRVHNYKPSPYRKASKLFLHSSAFMAKSVAQTLAFKSMTNRQTDRQTKNSTFLAAPAADETRAPPNLARL